MVARGALQAARDALSQYAYAATATDSLIGLAWLTAAGPISAGQPPPISYYTRANDTAATVALLFDVTVAALEAANPTVDWGNLTPGTKLTIPPQMALAGYVTVPGDSLSGIAAAWLTDAAAVQAANPGVDFSQLQPGTPVNVPAPSALFALAAANLSAPLAAGSLPIAGLSYQVRAGDTLQKIAMTDYGQPSVAVGAVGVANATLPGLLLVGGQLVLEAASGTIPYTIAAGDGGPLVAAFAYVRNLRDTPYAGDQNWFANAIAQANQAVDFTQPLAPGTSLTIPGATETPSGPSPTGQTSSYSAKVGDTLQFVAGYSR